jgi:hypothetical protein
MEARLHIDGLNDAIQAAVSNALSSRLAEINKWPYFTAEEAAHLLQVTVKTLLDKRKGYLQDLEYSKSGKTFWFLKDSVLSFVARRTINKKFRGVELRKPRRVLNIQRKSA